MIIKIRAWNIALSKMASWEEIKKHCNRLSFLEDKNWIFMLSTGLTDKNWKEIFGGDVDSKGRVVEYKVNMSGFYLMKNGEGSHLCHSQKVLNGRIKHLEIVGNIHENPELSK